MADLTTVQEVLDHFERNMSDEARRARAEVLALKEDIEAAQAAILDALERYRKKKLRARSRASANSADTFAALEGYGSREEIRDAYGWGIITERKMDRLMELWDLREQSVRPDIYTDRVIEMLEEARAGIFKRHGGPVRDWQQKEEQKLRDAKRIAEENFNRSITRDGKEVRL